MNITNKLPCIGALALGALTAVAAGALTGGAGFALIGSGFGAGASAGASAALIGTGVGHGMSTLFQGNGAFEQFKGGSGTTTSNTEITSINSNLTFTQNLNINANGEENYLDATIISNNINQQGSNLHIVEHNSQTQTINPNYQGIITGSAISGAIAGVSVSVNKFLENYTGVKPTFEKG